MERQVYDHWGVPIKRDYYRGYLGTPHSCECDCGGRAVKELEDKKMKCPDCGSLYELRVGRFEKINH
ncbi:hypothetical protein [Enterococcus sp. LJL51]|uniref:hypothetical protein n=1 Tax=Enterococcus sp. LJL51 TaxID=3416656 RepID=UPI003CEE3D7B